jgi:hypothetical protein
VYGCVLCLDTFYIVDIFLINLYWQCLEHTKYIHALFRRCSYQNPVARSPTRFHSSVWIMLEPALSRYRDFQHCLNTGEEHDCVRRLDMHRPLRKQILLPIDDVCTKRKKRRGLFYWKWISVFPPSYKSGNSTANMCCNADSDG